MLVGGGWGGARREKGWVYLFWRRSRHSAHVPSKVKLRELCKMSKGSKVVAISGQDLSSDSCPLILPYSVSLPLPNNTPYMNSNISVSRLTSALRVYLVWHNSTCNLETRLLTAVATFPYWSNAQLTLSYSPHELNYIRHPMDVTDKNAQVKRK